MNAAPSFLEVDGLTRHFGGIRALDGVSFAVDEKVVFGVIGPNGAGKTTLLNVLSGLTRPTFGAVRLRGERIERLPAHAIAARGVARTFQNIKLFRGATARDNVVIGQHLHDRTTLAGAVFFPPATQAAETDLRTRAGELLDLVGLAGKGDVPAGALSYGDARRLEIARALGSDPALLLLDEPAAGMNQIEVERLEELIRRLAAGGRAILLIEHHVGLVMRLCDRIAVLNFGVKIAEGIPAEVSSNDAVIEAYLGRE